MASIRNKTIGLLILFIATSSSLAKENPALNAVYRLFPIGLIRDSGGLVLASEYVSSLHPEKRKLKLRVDSEHFVYSD